MNQLKKSIQESLCDATNIKTEIPAIILIILLLATSMTPTILFLTGILPSETLIEKQITIGLITTASLIFTIIYCSIIYHIIKKNSKKTKFTKFAFIFMAVTLLALVPIILLATHTLDSLQTFIYETPGEPLKEYILSSIITETLNPFTLISILLWFLLFYSPFILLIENTGIIDSIKKSIKITTKQPELIALSIITANILFVLPLLIASTPFLLTLSPVIILIPNTLAAPISLILIIPAIIISTIISFSFIGHYYENALQKN